MDTVIRGKVFVVGDNVDTDQIIPAEFLSYDPADPQERKYFGKYALSGVPAAQSGLPKGDTPFVAEGMFESDFAVIVAGRNFGCGSSREHAPIAIKGAGISCVIAKSFARIFFRNAINIGLPILEAPEAVDALREGDDVEIDLTAGTVRRLSDGNVFGVQPFPEFLRRIIDAGGLMKMVAERIRQS